MFDELIHVNKTNFSIIKIVLLFYLITLSCSTNNIISDQVKDVVANSRIIQHFISFIIILVLINLLTGATGTTLAFHTVIIYLLFVMMTKMNIQWNMIVFMLLVIGSFVYESEHSKVIFGVIMAVIAVGFVEYIVKKKVQYGGGFDMDVFLFNPRN